MPTNRRSRFVDAARTVTRPSVDEALRPAVRDRAQRARMIAGSPTNAGYDEALARANAFLKVPGRDEACSDAIIAVNEERDGWLVRWVLARQRTAHAEAYVVRSVTVEAREAVTPPGGVTSNLLRELSPATSIDVATAHELDPQTYDGFVISQVATDVAASGPRPNKKLGGRPAIPDDELAAVAEAYLAELGRRGVLDRVHLRLIDQGYAVGLGQVRDRVRMARERQWLTPASGQGKRGAAAGPRLVQLRSEKESGT